jgi:hypothetical protein
VYQVWSTHVGIVHSENGHDVYDDDFFVAEFLSVLYSGFIFTGSLN